MMTYSSVWPGSHASTLSTVARVVSISTFRETGRESGKAKDAGFVLALICSCSSFKFFPAAWNQVSATAFFACTITMPTFSGPLTRQKIFFAVPQFSVDHDQCLGTMISRIDGFRDQLRVLR